MAEARTVDVTRLIDERGVSSFQVWLVVFAFFVVMIDGYDIAALGFAIPALVRDWHITDQASLGPALSASLLGMLVGAPALGALGDRVGRKIAIVLSCVLFGACTWLTVLTTTIGQIALLRLFAGIGIGGFMPNIIALVGEFAPRRFRATLIIASFVGVGFGGGIPGPVAALLVPTHGWQILFTIGGVVPFIVAAVCWIGLPESVKYLTITPSRRDDLLRMLKRMRPELTFGPETRFTIGDERQYRGWSPKHLFADGLGLITPLLWSLFILNLMGYFFLVSWTPFVLSSAHLPMSKAALAQTMFQLGATIGSWIICVPLDRKGPSVITILFALSVPFVAVIGYVGTISEPLLMAVEFLGGFCVLSLQAGLNATAASIYPTSFRSNGTGWALGVGRVGAMVGPVVGGALIAMHLPVGQLFVIAAIPFLVGAILCFWMRQLYVVRFKGTGLGQRAVLDAAATHA
ncbi:MAG TPA: MFS transporter [Stellaceae bacterium]|nr:MFS transporter [Stellaceae bacterium]